MARCRDLALDLVIGGESLPKRHECRFYWPPDEPSSAAITRAVRFYVSPPRPDRCDALVAELAAILARGQARLDARAINLAER
jgi:hypothetical protein